MDRTEKQLLLADVSDFLFEEAELLTDRKYEAWLMLLDDNMRYRMFIVRNLSGNSGKSEYHEDPLDVGWFDEDKEMLGKRVQQIRTGQHWAEDPPSRTTRFVTNIRLHEIAPDAVTVRYNFMVNRNRNEAEDDMLCGMKIDKLVRAGDYWSVTDRRVYINQSVILMGNLSFFI